MLFSSLCITFVNKGKFVGRKLSFKSLKMYVYELREYLGMLNFFSGSSEAYQREHLSQHSYGFSAIKSNYSEN